MHNIPDDIDMTDSGYKFQPADAEMKRDVELRANSAEAFLSTALGGNENVGTLTFLALRKLLDAYATHLLATIDRQAEELLVWREHHDEQVKRLKDGLRQMVSNTAIYGDNAGELAAQLLR